MNTAAVPHRPPGIHPPDDEAGHVGVEAVLEADGTAVAQSQITKSVVAF